MRDASQLCASERFDTAPEEVVMKNKPLILIALLLAAFAINLDTTIVNVA
ncbi:MAG: hypothetical protein JO372_24210, partial [Solirubrobacterales bacterium]|nr:hypothetical protein [Solirubrobacterales bacterium]